MEYRISNLQELSRWAQEFLKKCRPKEDHASIITLRGDLGAGKTALVKLCAQHLGIKDDITSPTFVIQKEYDLDDNHGFDTMIHIDAYRLESASELKYLGWDRLVANPKNLIFIEWPQMVEGIALPDATAIELNITENQERLLTVKKA
jgi:tRNA threonylcarbamoyladenosine biosynthesis protein TsaE